MTRDEMIQKLASVSFCLIDPSSDWKDIGFTEREIWVNAKGYGYIMCDEPTAWCEIEGVPLDKWHDIRNKLSCRNLQVEDIEGTSLLELLDKITYGSFCKDFDNPSDYLTGLLDLPAEELKCIFGLDTFGGWQFFATKEAFNKACERDWCDCAWNELSDEMLFVWINRLFNEGLLA